MRVTRSKYGNKKTVIDGIKFDSRKESVRYFDLKILQDSGKISDLELQPKFEIVPAVVWNNKALRVKHYIADFKYKQDGKTVIEDVKGFRTREYILKRQLFLLKYPEYIFREV